MNVRIMNPALEAAKVDRVLSDMTRLCKKVNMAPLLKPFWKMKKNEGGQRKKITTFGLT